VTSAITLVIGCSGPSGDDESSETLAAGSDTDAGDETGAGSLPAAPILLSPSDGALEVASNVELCWAAPPQETEHPDGEPLGYRVWVDEVELANGKTGEYGFFGTCTGPLDFVGDRSFAWKVRAFEAADLGRESPDSETWTFTTAATGDSEVLLFDDFSGDTGWTVSGDASTGAWVRGIPQAVYDVDSELAQPGACFAGDGCFYTADNPGGQLGIDDVDGGSVVLTSPPFDPGASASVSVSLARFFYRSDLVPTGVSLELALLVPDLDGEGTTVHVLDKLDGGFLAEPANAWEPVAFAACGIELRAGTRLRITASDLVVPESVIVEAAIDEVLIEGYPDTDICSPGLGALCDPDDPEPACGAELLCCAEGPVFDGVYRCQQPVPGLGDPPPSELPDNPGDPLTGPLGCNAPDLVVLDWDLDLYTQNIWVAPDSCTLYEGCVDGDGWRRVLRFDTKTANLGSRDLIMGVPANHPDLYTFSPCHAHHHFDNYANYTLLDGDAVVAAGHKQAFCLLDWEPYTWPEAGDEATFTCFNQGLSLGWSDTYGANLDCQWIDVTDVAPGDYTLRMDVNLPPPGLAHSTLVERDYTNNRLEIPVTL
jgi:hypothetical protein